MEGERERDREREREIETHVEHLTRVSQTNFLSPYQWREREREREGERERERESLEIIWSNTCEQNAICLISMAQCLTSKKYW